MGISEFWVLEEMPTEMNLSFKQHRVFEAVNSWQLKVAKIKVLLEQNSLIMKIENFFLRGVSGGSDFVASEWLAKEKCHGGGVGRLPL